MRRFFFRALATDFIPSPLEVRTEHLRPRLLRPPGKLLDSEDEQNAGPERKLIDLAELMLHCSLPCFSQYRPAGRRPALSFAKTVMSGLLVRQIDKYAEAHGYTRSGLLTQAAKKLMAEAA
jgi:hypothetical protein